MKPEFQSLTLAEAELRLHEGRMSSDDYEHYCCCWRNSVSRVSDECQSYEKDPIGCPDCPYIQMWGIN